MVDIERKDLAQKKKKKRIIMITVSSVVFILLFVGLSQLKPATPSVEKGAVWIDTVKRGPLLREVRGVGTLIPENNRLITALSSGVVDELYIFPGAAIEENTLILRMSNPQLEQDAENAQLNLESRQAELSSQEVLLQSQMLQLEAGLAQLEAGFRIAQKEVEVNEELFKEGLLAEVTLELGTSSTFVVLRMQRDLAQAETREIVAITDYNKAIAEYNRITGETLAKYNTVLP
jgi:HlyD family secretion protein